MRTQNRPYPYLTTEEMPVNQDVREVENMTPTSQSRITVMTRTVADTLTPEQIDAAMTQLHEKMKVQDPANPDLWTVAVDGCKLWAILDHRAGPNGEDVLTLLFSEDY